MVRPVDDRAQRARIDLHCHSSASFDGRVDPVRLLALAVERGLSHLAITDHDTLDGALRARDVDHRELTIIVGQEARTTDGDLIALFVERPIRSGLSLADTAAAIREQGGLVGLPHPFDASRPSLGAGRVRPAELAALAGLVDYVEVHNGRVSEPAANAYAAEFALKYDLPQVAVSDAHSEREVGTSATILTPPLHDPAALLSSLARRGSLYVHDTIPSPDDARRWSRLLRRGGG